MVRLHWVKAYSDGSMLSLRRAQSFLERCLSAHCRCSLEALPAADGAVIKRLADLIQAGGFDNRRTGVFVKIADMTGIPWQAAMIARSWRVALSWSAIDILIAEFVASGWVRVSFPVIHQAAGTGDENCPMCREAVGVGNAVEVLCVKIDRQVSIGIAGAMNDRWRGETGWRSGRDGGKLVGHLSATRIATFADLPLI